MWRLVALFAATRWCAVEAAAPDAWAQTNASIAAPVTTDCRKILQNAGFEWLTQPFACTDEMKRLACWAERVASTSWPLRLSVSYNR